MSRYSVEVANEEGFVFLNRFTPIHWCSWTKSIVQKRDGVIVAAIVYQEANAHNAWMHVAAEPGVRWVTRDLVYWTFNYPFVQLGLTRLTGWVEEDNKAAIRFDEHVGFKREATLKGAGQRGQDVHLYAMFREDCRYGGVRTQDDMRRE